MSLFTQIVSLPLTCAFAPCLERAVPLRRCAHIVAGRWMAVLGSWRASGPRLAGFQCTGQAGHGRVDVPEPAAGPGRGEPPLLGGPFPGQAQVRSERPGEAQLAWTVMMIQVQRSAAAGSRSFGVVHPRTCLNSRKVCSRHAGTNRQKVCEPPRSQPGRLKNKLSECLDQQPIRADASSPAGRQARSRATALRRADRPEPPGARHGHPGGHRVRGHRPGPAGRQHPDIGQAVTVQRQRHDQVSNDLPRVMRRPPSAQPCRQAWLSQANRAASSSGNTPAPETSPHRRRTR
jgi:hypothetical protein